MVKLLRTVVLFLVPMAAFGQSIDNVRATSQGDKVVITFDIMNVKQGSNINVQLFSSHNGFSVPLTYVSGDVGPNVKPGSGKRAEWDAATELKSFTGEVTFEVRGEVIAGWLIKNVSTLRKGKNATFQWEGGSGSDNVKLELVNGTQITLIGEGRNTGTYNWTVPKDAATATDYKVRLTSGSNVITSNPFGIKKKKSPLIFILPIAVVGGLVFALLPKPTPTPVPPKDDPLPNPPDPQ